MRSGLGAAIDRRLQNLTVALARRRWRALRLVPVRWLRPLVASTALRIRHVLSVAVIAAVLAVGVILALVLL